MPNKTLYVRPEDEQLWEAAAAQAKRERRSLSALVVEALSALLPDDDAPVLIDRATIEIVLLDHREELDDAHGKVSPSLAELAHVYRELTGFDAKAEAGKVSSAQPTEALNWFYGDDGQPHCHDCKAEVYLFEEGKICSACDKQEQPPTETLIPKETEPHG